MKLNRLMLGASSIFLAICATAQAAEDERFMVSNAGDLAVLCSVTPENPRHAAAMHMCVGYFLGVHHFHTAMHADGSPGIYCVPETGAPSRNEVAAEFSAWANDTPEHAALPAVEGVVRWAAERFPCS